MAYSVLVSHYTQSGAAELKRLFTSLGVNAAAACSLRDAHLLIRFHPIELAVAYPRLSDGTILDLLHEIDGRQCDLVVIADRAVTPHIRQAAMRGAAVWVGQPSTPKDAAAIMGLVGAKRSAERRKEVSDVDFIGDSEPIQNLMSLLVKVVPNRHPVLIIGETGTGKEILARLIHRQGPWGQEPFVAVDCGALTPTLVESELFGYVRGAFTGATHNRKGLLPAAGRGTLFLDEIGELPRELQPKLLRALQERSVRPLGSNDLVPFEARVIAATNRDLGEAVRKGEFRPDLFYRICALTIVLPPLRERRADILPLAEYFLYRYGGPSRGVLGFSPAAMARLLAHHWPGNVRELENCVQSAVALSPGPLVEPGDLRISADHLALGAINAHRAPTPLRDLERRAILGTLEAVGGDCLHAARLLGISKTTIYRKLKEYGLQPPVREYLAQNGRIDSDKLIQVG